MQSDLKNWDDIRANTIKDTKSMMGHTDYRELGVQLSGFIADGYQKQAKEIIIALLHEYQNRPALKYELEKLLTVNEVAKYKKWCKTHHHKSTLICTKCGSSKIVRVVYGFPTEETFRAADMGLIQLGGCVVGYDKYYCNNCETYYESKPRDPNIPIGPIVVVDNSKQEFLIITNNKRSLKDKKTSSAV